MVTKVPVVQWGEQDYQVGKGQEILYVGDIIYLRWALKGRQDLTN